MAVRVESLHEARSESRGETRIVRSPVARHDLNGPSGGMPASTQPSNGLACASPALFAAMVRMAVPTLGYDCSTDSLHDEICYTLARLKPSPFLYLSAVPVDDVVSSMQSRILHRC